MVSSPSLTPIGAKLTPYYSNKSANGRMELVILSQPEEQHRARYLTEGSRGAIKDLTGMGHPVVKLNGYYSRQPIKLECYIGHDKHNGLPHLFYQASKISGKNSTQCTACKVEGTSVIVMNLLPENGMQASIDCVGILKERNVDVEQKLLNLNHSNKMLEFSDQHQHHQHQQQQQPQQHHTHHQPQQQHNGFQSPFASIAQQHQQQQQLISSSLTNPVCNGNDQHHHPALKFERGDTNSSQMDENSIGAMSRADSLDDSSDLSRHSIIQAATNHAKQHNGSLMNNNNGLTDNHHQALMQNSANLLALNSRKRSVRCRLVFRVKIPETGEVLQTISTPIICTQPLGTPEICKKSVSKASVVANNLELFIIGKNFLKDSKIVFKNKKNDWIKTVEPDKEFLNSSHMICRIPDYDGPDLNDNLEVIEVEMQVRSGGKYSEPHNFYYVTNFTQPSSVHLNGVVHLRQLNSIEEHLQQQQHHHHQQEQQQQQQQQQQRQQQQQQQQQQQELQQQLQQQQHQVQQQQLQLHHQNQLNHQQQQQSQQQSQQQLQQQHQQQPQIHTIQIHDNSQQQQQQIQHQQSPPLSQQVSPQSLQQTPSPTQTMVTQQIHAQIHEQQQQQQQHHQIHAPPPPPPTQQHYQPEPTVQQIFESQQQAQIHTIQDSQQIQQQIVIHQQQPQQTQQQQPQQNVSSGQLLATIDLNDETTVVYADSLQTSQPTLVHSVIQNGATLQNGLQLDGLQGTIQNGTIISASIGQLEQSTIGQSINGHFTTQLQLIKQQQQQQQQPTTIHQQYQTTATKQTVQQQFEVVQQASVIQEHQQQIQQQIVLQQQQQQQLMTSLDLNDDSTVVYADNLQNPQAESSTEALLFSSCFS